MTNGWIKLHRKLIENPIFPHSQYVHLWVTLLLLANHEPKKMLWNGHIIVIKEGQMVTGREKLSELTGIPESTVERILSTLEKECQIEQQKTTKYRLVTIVNWKEYQNSDNKRTTDGQQMDTNKKYKKIKKYKKDTIAADAAPMSLSEFLESTRKSPRRYIRLIGEYADEKKLAYSTKGQWREFLKRNLRAAKQLEPFDDKQLGEAIKSMYTDRTRMEKEGKSYKWGMETLIKYLEA